MCVIKREKWKALMGAGRAQCFIRARFAWPLVCSDVRVVFTHLEHLGYCLAPVY